jgi:hypothetical protein
MDHASKKVVGVLLQRYVAGDIAMPYRFSRAKVDGSAPPVFAPLDVRILMTFVCDCAHVEYRRFSATCTWYITVPRVDVTQHKLVCAVKSAGPSRA